jgi:hypothetical protein
MKANFLRKPTSSELIPQTEFAIDKFIEVTNKQFDYVVAHPLNDYQIIKDNKDYMYMDEQDVYHCIGITCNSRALVIVIESEGYDYIRYGTVVDKDDAIKNFPLAYYSRHLNTPIKVGSSIKIINMVDDPSYVGKTGVVKDYDREGRIYGTWGDKEIILPIDKVEVIENE